MWQDAIFLFGSIFSIISLTPTLRSVTAAVPWATSFPSAAIGMVYAATWFTLGMTFSAIGSLAAGIMWSLILMYRRPSNTPEPADTTVPQDATAN